MRKDRQRRIHYEAPDAKKAFCNLRAYPRMRTTERNLVTCWFCITKLRGRTPLVPMSQHPTRTHYRRHNASQSLCGRAATDQMKTPDRSLVDCWACVTKLRKQDKEK